MGEKAPKIIALYLPQYYETEYNNKWWGKGYTEWMACKQSKPLFKGHYQPRAPLDNNYYNLSKKENIKWQMDMAAKYGIDGFAIYQYYSCGKKLLEVPTEIIRDNDDLNLPFFLFWANESWRKMWFGQDKTVIWEQKYGEEKEWREQFLYCLDYFKKDNYIKIDNMPVYVIYNAWDFKKIDKFIECWDKWAREEGFKGIYFTKALGRKDKVELGAFSATVTREPNYTFAFDENLFEKLGRVSKLLFLKWLNKNLLMPHGKGIVALRKSYDRIWEKIVSREKQAPNVFLGAFVDWDASPRRSYNAIIMDNVSSDKFGYYMKRLIKKAVEIGSPMIVINAWNEWAEGAYLEPDEKNRYQFLEKLKQAKYEAIIDK